VLASYPYYNRVCKLNAKHSSRLWNWHKRGRNEDAMCSRNLLLGKEFPPETPLLLPIGHRYNWLKLTEMNRIVAPFDPGQE